MPPDGPGSTSFVVIRTDWSVLTALRALDATDATHVILAHRGARGDELHLFQADDIFYDAPNVRDRCRPDLRFAASRMAVDAHVRPG